MPGGMVGLPRADGNTPAFILAAMAAAGAGYIKEKVGKNMMSAGVLGNETRIRTATKRGRKRKLSKRVGRWRKAVKKVIRNANEPRMLRRPPTFSTASSADPRLRSYKIPANKCVLIPVWNKGVGTLSDSTNRDTLWPGYKTGGADVTFNDLAIQLDSIGRFTGNQFYSEGLSVKFLVTHNMLEQTPNGQEQWYVGWKLINISEAKSNPTSTITGTDTAYLCPLTGKLDATTIQPIDSETGSYAESNPSCIVDKHDFLKDITTAAVPSASNVESWVDFMQEGRLAKGITVLNSGYLVVPDNPMFTRTSTNGVKKHVTHNLFLPTKRVFDMSRIEAAGKIPVYDRSFLMLWAYNETLGYASTTNTPTISMMWTHRFRDNN